MLFQKPPLISICIPLYGTEDYLPRCLESVSKQNFERLEIIIVDDGSPAAKENSAEKIIRNFKANSKIPVTLICHEENKGLVETRRSAVYQAKGKYLFILDSDDQLEPNALTALYAKAEENGADIVQGKADAVFSETQLMEIDSEQTEKYRQVVLAKINKVYGGQLNGAEILSGYFENSNHNGILWAKLIRREVYLEAFSHIPPIFCTMAEDVVQYFWLAVCAKKYVGIQDVVYRYSINTGISSRTKIENLNRWEKVCSTSSVFTAIYTELERLETEENIKVLTDLQRAHLNAMCRFYLKNNLSQLNSAVVPELKDEAYRMLCDYWGESFVHRIESLN
ncbi:glycosyltransferase family 2 protein [Treponema sp.]|uniref:glycosyltransferase family 2 protein n=1 Tax=Treponema sp. TaxID=166 RepID=UPI00298E2A3A|nr:glycosyltransferase family 2 protein [Treponema sp.]MCQ2241489.1 glycosyltransferase [Treponema sp.]